MMLWCFINHLHIFSGIFEGMIGTVSGGAIALVLWYGGKLVNEHIISAGVVTCEYECAG